MTDDLKPAHYSPPVKVAVVEFVLLDDVVIEQVEVFIGK
jgi:hypothetical protein